MEAETKEDKENWISEINGSIHYFTTHNTATTTTTTTASPSNKATEKVKKVDDMNNNSNNSTDSNDTGDDDDDDEEESLDLEKIKQNLDSMKLDMDDELGKQGKDMDELEKVTEKYANKINQVVDHFSNSKLE